MSVPQPAVLRPLALGEVLDRAVNLCVRNFVPLALIFVVYAVPLAFVQYLASQDLARVVQALTHSLGAGNGKAPDPQVLARSLGSLHPSGWYALFMALTFFVGPLPAAALIYATTQAYLGRATSFAGAYRVAAGRWAPLVGLNIVYALAFMALYVVLTLGLIVLISGIAFLTLAIRGVGIVVASLVGISAIAAMLAFFVVAALAFQVSYFTCVVEGASVPQAFSLGLSRVFRGVGLRRSLLVGVVFFSLGIGIALVSAIGEALLDGVLKSGAVGSAYATLVRVATAAFTTAFVGIFYFDLRVREEGFDLQLAAQSTQLAQPPPA